MVSKSKILADWLSEMPTRGREKEGGVARRGKSHNVWKRTIKIVKEWKNIDMHNTSKVIYYHNSFNALAFPPLLLSTAFFCMTAFTNALISCSSATLS